MRAFVALTDYDWFTFLRAQAPDEVNFWQPSGSRRFGAVAQGELLLFKLHSPRNYIVGGGVFAHSSLLPCSLAWEAFGTKNGAHSFDEMRRRVERYRRAAADSLADYTIGCTILAEPFFLPEASWISVPSDFHRNTQVGKRYDMMQGAGRQLFEALQERIVASTTAVAEQNPVAFVDRLARYRLGQGAFRVVVTDAYDRRCAITRERTLPVLDAAHIRPVTRGGEHRASNGLLLRSDIHTLFDRGYVTITPDYRFRVSPQLRRDYSNGRHYYALDGEPIALPGNAGARPEAQLLEWHADTVFRR
jgi:putative restriction endonuclease